LKAADEGRIVNVSSLYGLVSPPGQSAYSASKFAVRGFSNALRHELEGTNVGVTVVHPVGVATSIAKNARVSASIDAEEVERRRKQADRLLRMPPQRACEHAIDDLPYRLRRFFPTIGSRPTASYQGACSAAQTQVEVRRSGTTVGPERKHRCSHRQVGRA
jgi:short-subunit dehydrogenase